MSAYRIEALVDKYRVHPKEEFHILALVHGIPRTSWLSILSQSIGSKEPYFRADISRSEIFANSEDELRQYAYDRPTLDSVKLEKTDVDGWYIGSARIAEHGCFQIRINGADKSQKLSEATVDVTDLSYVKEMITNEFSAENIHRRNQEGLSLPQDSLRRLILSVTDEVLAEMRSSPRRYITIQPFELSDSVIPVEPARSLIKWLLKLFCESLVWKGNATISSHIQNNKVVVQALLMRDRGLDLVPVERILEMRLPYRGNNDSFFTHNIDSEKPELAKIMLEFPFSTYPK